MALHHVGTFLRSALARDPFCHGGIITPDDVLRLEAKFPTLFDKPANPTSPTKVAESNRIYDGGVDDEYKEDVDDLVKERPKNVTSRNPKMGLSNKSAQGKDNRISTTKKKPAQAMQRAQPPPAQKRKPSEFHKKCVEKGPPPMGWTGHGKKASVGKNVATAAAAARPVKAKVSGTSKLTRPAQSFSLEDLRATLRQVMEEDSLQQSKWLRSDNSPSPYTEDLVKKFLGWKLKQQQQQHHKATVTSKNTNSNLGKLKGQGDETSRMKALTDTIAAYYDTSPHKAGRNKLTPHTATISGKIEKEKAVPRVRSAPGFIRGIPELPPVPKYHRKRITQNVPKPDKHTTGQQANVDERDGMERSQGGGDGDSGRKQVRWEEEGGEMKEEDERHRKDGHDHGMTDDTSQMVYKPKGSGMRGTQIHLCSNKHKRSIPEQETAEAAFSNDGRFKVKSSYQDLLAAHSEKTRYQVKGLFRRQEIPNTFYEKQLQRERTEKRNQRRKHGSNFWDPDSSSDPSNTFARKMKEMGQRSKEETNRVLEIMAKELVYLEVLHQINELKQGQKDSELNAQKRELLNELKNLPSSTSSSPRQKPHKLSEIVLPHFVPTTTDHESESGDRDKKKGDGKASKSSSEIILKTPELTPPSMGAANKRAITEKKKSSPRKFDNADIISLHTPELSPSPKRLIAAIKERRELEKKLQASPPQQLDTDCSEISDFIFSEPSKREDKRIPPVQEEESVQLRTPQLSGGVDDVRSPDDDKPDKCPEKDKSTLSSVPSEFLETHSGSRKSLSHKPEANANDIEKSNQSANYSDDFTPEKVSSSAAPSVKDKAPLSLQMISDDSSKSNAGPNKHLNTSGETVIDLLSEGEFIGPSYRSPGELSWCQQTHPRPLFPSSSNPSVAASSSNRQRMAAHSSSFGQQQESVTNSAIKGSGDSDDDEESISVLSYGAQIPPENGQQRNTNVSLGEYL